MYRFRHLDPGTLLLGPGLAVVLTEVIGNRTTGLKDTGHFSRKLFIFYYFLLVSPQSLELLREKWMISKFWFLDLIYLLNANGSILVESTYRASKT